MIMKKSILFVYPHMAIGGSTTSLLSILNLIDYDKYDVDLLLGSDQGDLLPYIPKKVNHLKQALPSKRRLKLKKMFSFRYMHARTKTKRMPTNIKYQYFNYYNAVFSRKLEKTYDVAIAFLETYACDYVAEFVKAKKKLFWLHLDYIGAGFEKDFDEPIYSKFNNIVLVSNVCKHNFDKVFPELADRSIVIENILSQDFVRRRSEESCDLIMNPDYINLVSVCRIDFNHKGLDRGIESILYLKKHGVNNVKWYIVGDGKDNSRLQELINQNALENDIFVLGAKINPAPYMKNADAFFLPSRYEGKPMAVTEAMMIGIPPVVAEYASAAEQITNGIDGFIFENTQEGLNKGLLEICRTKEMLKKCRDYLLTKDYSNMQEMEKIYAIIN